MTPTLQHDPKLGVAYVEVNDEPHHIEQLRNAYVRVYLATIEPGTCTLNSPTPRQHPVHRHVGGLQHIRGTGASETAHTRRAIDPRRHEADLVGETQARADVSAPNRHRAHAIPRGVPAHTSPLRRFRQRPADPNARNRTAHRSPPVPKPPASARNSPDRVSRRPGNRLSDRAVTPAADRPSPFPPAGPPRDRQRDRTAPTRAGHIQTKR